MDITPHEWEICLKVLQQVADDPAIINEHERMKGLVAKIHREGKRGQRTTARRAAVARDRQRRQTAGILNKTAPDALPDVLPDDASQSLERFRNCYICKRPFRELHFFYHLICPQCADLNWAKRGQRADLRGRRALVTGGRIKIGHETALRLLRDGAHVAVTTRFARDAAQRFAAHADFATWRERLTIYALDFRRVPDVEAFAAYFAQNEPSLDILINNAAQTVKRPLAFYQHLLEAETALPLSDAAQNLLAPPLAPAAVFSGPALLETLPFYPAEAHEAAHFPEGAFDADGQQLDARPLHSWRLKLGEVGTVELLETHLVNAIAPFILNSALKPLLLRSPFARRFIVNVSAMEGQFNRQNKTVFHPHTNMAKAALNMLTRTAAADYAQSGIYMNSVDTGWITDENPLPMADYLREEQGFYTPLDIVDGMARVYDPIARGVSEPHEPIFGYFLKDYAPHAW